MNVTFYKNGVSPIHLVMSIVLVVACIIVGIVYDGDMGVKVAIPVIGILVTVGWMIYSYNKQDVYKRIKLTEEYVQVVSYFKIGYKINFDQVATVGKMGFSHTKTSWEKYFISTVPLTRGKEIDMSNTITFDVTAKSRRAMSYLAEKYCWEIVEI